MSFLDEYIDKIASALEAGQIVLYPTDTIWGLGCDAANAQALSRVRSIRKLPSDSPMIILVDSIDMLRRYVSYIPQKAANLIEYYERPLTIVYQQIQALPQELLASDGSLAIRVCQDPFCKAIIHKLDRPIVATSAVLGAENTAPWSFVQIEEQLKTLVDVVVEYRQEEQIESGPSAIVQIEGNEDLNFLRKQEF